MMKNNDKHHILFNRQEWSLRKEARMLRNNPELIPLMDYDIHRELHKECPPVPLLSQHVLNLVMNGFKAVPGDTLATMGNLTTSIAEALESPHIHELEREMGGLTIRAIELQRPFVKEGLIYVPENS